MASWARIKRVLKMNHIPVLLNEVIKILDPKSGDIILDATIDGGGHAEAILKKIMPIGKLIGIEQDKEILNELDSRIKTRSTELKENLILINGNFRNLDKLLEPLKIKKLDAALFDLGMSSIQLESSGRGFSFLRDEPLNMSYKNPIEPGDLTAGEIINKWPEEKIADILFHYGEERFARRIARNIIEERQKKEFKTTSELVLVIKRSVPRPYCFRRIHPATKTFQALRIAVNDELSALEEGLNKVWNFFVPGSRIAVISFHSLEDRIVKNFLKSKSRNDELDIKTPKPIRPSREECLLNPRSRSAKLRAAVKF